MWRRNNEREQPSRPLSTQTTHGSSVQLQRAFTRVEPVAIGPLSIALPDAVVEAVFGG
jgi:hypothetical protein